MASENKNSPKQFQSAKSLPAPNNGINFTIQQKQAPVKNNTGLPDNLKSGIEHLSGIDISDVKVHYNSSQPAQLYAHAYAQGNQIHVAPRQEKYLPHEAWHVVQQKQGRVKMTKQLKGKVNINDDVGLEKEADVMGAKAISLKTTNKVTSFQSKANASSALQRVKFENDDIHGFQSIETTINEELESQKINPTDTLFISVGRSPIIFTKYLQLNGSKVVYVPMSGLSAYGKIYQNLKENHDQHLLDNSEDILSHYLKPYLKSVKAMVVIDFGVSGGSNKAACDAVKQFLKKNNAETIQVRMATIVLPSSSEEQVPKELANKDNLLYTRSLDYKNEAVQRVLWAMHLEIDKQFGFLPKYDVNTHSKGKKPPVNETTKEEKLELALNKAMLNYTARLKKGNYQPQQNQLDRWSGKKAWINEHRLTIMDKLGDLGSNRFVQVIIVAILAFLAFWLYTQWFSKEDNKKISSK